MSAKKKILFELLLALVFASVLFIKSAGVAQASDFGFNLWNLTNLSPTEIHTVLSNLGDSCNTTIVRIWGYQFTNGIDGLNNLQKVFDNAPSNIKFIVALEDFPFGPPEADPGAWFGGGYKQSDDGGAHPSYRAYVSQVVSKYRGKVFMWELMNEPHCKGDASCPAKLTAWASDISNIIRQNDSTALISAGMIGDNLADQAYEAVTSLPNITANSCHFYNKDGPETQCNEPKAIVKVKGKFFYVGEAGYSLENACTVDKLSARASYFKQKQEAFSPDAFLIWQFQTEGAGDQFSVESTADPVCKDNIDNVDPNACNGSGGRSSKITSLYGRDAYNRLLVMGNSRYFPWNYPYCAAISSDQYSKDRPAEEFKTCGNGISTSDKTSCPDYSPNRPYSGDTCLDFLDTHNDSGSDVVQYQMKNFPIGGEVNINLCNVATQSCLDPSTTVPVSIVGKNAVYYKDAFVDFLGTNNEYTSNPNFVMGLQNNILRTATYLTDFLGGMTDVPGIRGRSHEMKDYIDAYLEYQKTGDTAAYQAKIGAIPNLKENLQLTSGAIGKLMPDLAKLQTADSENTIIERWAKSNLPHINNSASYASNMDPKLVPVGDYVLAYKCTNSPETFVNEDEFVEQTTSGATTVDSLEKRSAIIKSKAGEKCDKNSPIYPIRISDFFCSSSNTSYWDAFSSKYGSSITSGTKKAICRGKEDPGNDPLKIYKWSVSDLDVIQKYFMTTTTHEDTPVRVVLSCPSNYGPPPVEGKEIAPGVAYFKNDLDEGEMRQKAVDRYAFGGQYNATNKVYDYTTVTRTFIYVGHLAEAREQSYNLDQMLLPAALQGTQINYVKEKLSTFDTSVAQGVAAAPGAKGDLIAEDSMNRAAGDASQLTSYQIAKNVEISKYQDQIDKWLAGSKTNNKDVAVPLSANCTVSVEIPYIQETAARTIGDKHGFYRLFFSEADQKIIDDQIATSDTKGNAVINSQYLNNTTSSDQSFFIPWVDAMKIYNSYLNLGGNPLGVQKATVK